MYGKRGNRLRQKVEEDRLHFLQLKEQQASIRPQPQPQMHLHSQTSGALIRLGEGIVVEWHEDAWSKVFDGYGNSVDLRGSRTFANMERLRDVELEQRRKVRSSRRSRGITLDECLDEFEKAEVLSAQDMWYCPRCKEHRRASKKFDVWKTPDILVCHLKRFSSNRRDKLDMLVDFPVQGLDLTRRVLNKEAGKEEVYDLIAVDDHYGGLGGGHYTAYAKNFVDGRWYNYNGASCCHHHRHIMHAKADTNFFFFKIHRPTRLATRKAQCRRRPTSSFTAGVLPFLSVGLGSPTLSASTTMGWGRTTTVTAVGRGKTSVSPRAHPGLDRRALEQEPKHVVLTPVMV